MMKLTVWISMFLDIPADLVDEANEWKEKLVEAVAESNDTLMEKFFEDPDSITEREMLDAIRVATINMSINPIICGSAFKNKGVQTLLDYSMEFLPSPLDIGAIEGTDISWRRSFERGSRIFKSQYLL